MAKRFAYFKHKEDYDVEIEKQNAIDKDSIVFLEDTNSIANDSEIYEGVEWSKIIDDDMPHVESNWGSGSVLSINGTPFCVKQNGTEIYPDSRGKWNIIRFNPVNFYFQDGIIPKNCFYSKAIETVSLHGIRDIQEYAFARSILTSMPDLNGVETIHDSAFSNLSMYRTYSLHIPKSVINIHVNPWWNTRISTITADEENPKYWVSGNCLCDSNNIIVAGNNPTIPDHVKRLEYHSFYDKELDTLVIPNTIYELAEPFFDCNITNLIIDLNTYIPRYAFTQCTIENLIITNCPALMGYAFHTCVIKKIEFPENLSTISEFCFTGSSTEEIICHAKKAPDLYRNNFGNTGVLKVPTGSDYSSWLEQLGSGWTIEYI